jgi:hypothetical protein
MVISCQQIEYFSSLVKLRELAVNERELITELEALTKEVDDEYLKL